MKQRVLLLVVLAVLTAYIGIPNSFADTYSVNRSFSQGVNTAALVGTVDVVEGDYTIMNGIPDPFTAVNLTLTVDGTPYTLTNAVTSVIFGTGQFIVDATSTQLIFNTANANGSNPADLIFSDGTGDKYAIGYDGDPGFEIAITSAGSAVVSQSFPTIFGVEAVSTPEPSTFALLGLGLIGLIRIRNHRGGFHL